MQEMGTVLETIKKQGYEMHGHYLQQQEVESAFGCGQVKDSLKLSRDILSSYLAYLGRSSFR